MTFAVYHDFVNFPGWGALVRLSLTFTQLDWRVSRVPPQPV